MGYDNFDDMEKWQKINAYRAPILSAIKETNNFDDFLKKIFDFKVEEPFYSDWKNNYESSKKWYEIADNALNLGLNSKAGIDYSNDMQKAMEKGAIYCDSLIKQIIAFQLIEAEKVDFIDPNDVYDYLGEEKIEHQGRGK